MKKLVLSGLSFILLTQAGFAIYPIDRSGREICDIVTSHELRRLLPPSESIIDVRRVQRGYIVTTSHYQVIVDVIYGPYGSSSGEQEGPASFKFHEPTEI